MFEFDFIEWLRSQTSAHPNVELGVGDDAAILKPNAARQVLTTDLLMEGVHFELSSATFEQIGRKSLAVSLSDIAAMGAVPTVAVLNFAFPRQLAFADAQAVFRGALQLAREYHVAIVGGDTNRWSEKLVVGSTVLGQLEHSGWRISGAEPGDVVLVSGELGGSLLGKHLDFTPRCQLAAEIASRYPVHAATDISDSLSLDLNEIALQSNLGITLQADSIPLAAAAKQRAAQSGRTQLDHALYDGEDFELLFTVSSETAKAILRDQTLSSSLTEIGYVRAEPGELLIIRGSKAPEPLPIKGYEH